MKGCDNKKMEEMIRLQGITKKYGNNLIIPKLDLTIYDGEFLTLLGPSGCGKTTLLRMIAGLDTPTTGKVFLDDEDVTNKPPYKRDVNMVFQHYALFPHMTVEENIKFGLMMKKVPAEEQKERVAQVLYLTQLEEFRNRRPQQMSGGQQQRVAIARALVNNPKVLLLDEPLGALDYQLRKNLQLELKNLQRGLGLTFIYVTHDQTEAMTLGTKIVVMKDGLIQQVGAPQSIYDNPVNLFVAGFLGSPSMNFFRCTVKAEENNRTALLLDDAKTVKKVYLDGTRGKQIADRYNGRHVILGIRPEDIYELDEAKKLGIENESVDVDEPVVNREMLGAEVILYFDEQGKTLAVRLSPENQTQVGEKVSLYFDMEKAHVFDPETEENIFVS